MSRPLHSKNSRTRPDRGNTLSEPGPAHQSCRSPELDRLRLQGSGWDQLAVRPLRKTVNQLQRQSTNFQGTRVSPRAASVIVRTAPRRDASTDSESVDPAVSSDRRAERAERLSKGVIEDLGLGDERSRIAIVA
jgi:hypothetical protein